MKILMVNSFYYPNEIGGAERSVRILAEEFVRQGNEVSVLCLGDRDSIREHEGVKIIEVKCSNIYTPTGRGESRSNLVKAIWHFFDWFNPVAIFQYLSVLRTAKPDVIHTNNISGISCAIWAAAKLLKVPVVHTARDFYLVCASATMMKDGVSCSAQCSRCRNITSGKRWSSNSLARVVHISEFMRGVHRGANTLSRPVSRVIYNPFVPPKQDSLAFSTKSRKGWVVGYLGRIDPAKGIEIAIGAVTSLNKSKPSSLLVAGDGESNYVESLKLSLGSDDSIVSFLGKVDSETFLRSIDLLLVPSVWNEPLGRVVLEAFSAGVPVVVTPVGGLPEVAKGYSAIVASRVDSSAVEEALTEMLGRLELDGNGVRLAALASSLSYTPKRIADEYLGVFAEAITEASN